jgi:cbb3-type cytochrome oxidase subunit 3
MNAAESQKLVDTIIAGGVAIGVILLLLLTVAVVFFIIRNKTPDARTQADAMTLARDMQITNTTLALEIRKDGKHREETSAAHQAAMLAQTEVLKAILEAQQKDTVVLSSITTAVTTTAADRHKELITTLLSHEGFYPAIIEEIRLIKTAVNTLPRRRKTNDARLIRVALKRIEALIKESTNAQVITPVFHPRIVTDWRYAVANHLRTDRATVARTSANGHRAVTGYDTNDA